MTKVISFSGGPGSGKSTLAAQLFGWMKKERMNVEYAAEYAKDLAWQGSSLIDDQIHVFGEQHKRIYSLLDKVDFIITDSPLFLSAQYLKNNLNKFKNSEKLKAIMTDLIIETYNSYDNVTFFVDRGNRKYVPHGRYQTEEEAKKLDNSIKNMMDHYKIRYDVVMSLEEVIQKRFI